MTRRPHAALPLVVGAAGGVWRRAGRHTQRGGCLVTTTAGPLAKFYLLPSLLAGRRRARAYAA